MELEEIKNLQNFLEIYPNSAIMDFNGKDIKKTSSFSTVVIGCEGGFSENERKIFTNKPIYKLNTPMILKSESAAISIGVMVLL